MHREILIHIVFRFAPHAANRPDRHWRSHCGDQMGAIAIMLCLQPRIFGAGVLAPCFDCLEDGFMQSVGMQNTLMRDTPGEPRGPEARREVCGKKELQVGKDTLTLFEVLQRNR